MHLKCIYQPVWLKQNNVSAKTKIRPLDFNMLTEDKKFHDSKKLAHNIVLQTR